MVALSMLVWEYVNVPPVSPGSIALVRRSQLCTSQVYNQLGLKLLNALMLYGVHVSISRHSFPDNGMINVIDTSFTLASTFRTEFELDLFSVVPSFCRLCHAPFYVH